MKLLFIIIVASIHLLTFIDALLKIKRRNGGFLVALSLFPPIIGPILYYFYSKNRKSRERPSFFKKSSNR